MRRWLSSSEQYAAVEGIAEAVTELSHQRHGAIIVLERSTGLEDYIESGVRLGAAPAAGGGGRGRGAPWHAPSGGAGRERGDGRRRRRRLGADRRRLHRLGGAAHPGAGRDARALGAGGAHLEKKRPPAAARPGA